MNIHIDIELGNRDLTTVLEQVAELLNLARTLHKSTALIEIVVNNEGINMFAQKKENDIKSTSSS